MNYGGFETLQVSQLRNSSQTARQSPSPSAQSIAVAGVFRRAATRAVGAHREQARIPPSPPTFAKHSLRARLRFGEGGQFLLP